MINSCNESQVFGDAQFPEQVNQKKDTAAILDAISVGVEQLIDPYLAYRKTIARMTVSIAHKIGISAEESETWIKKRSSIDIDGLLQ
jgi:hypothetical protein